MDRFLSANPKVSVIMGIYNCADTLPAAIDSILEQTYTNWELVMCDDASNDDTFNIALGYQNRYPEKMVLLRNDRNMRLAYALNRCLEHVSGELIARMDGDDISLTQRFEKQVDYLQCHPNVDLVGTSMQYFNEAEDLHTVIPKMEYPDYYTLRNAIPFHHATIMTYKLVYDTLQGYTVLERTKRAQDYDLWFRFFHVGFKGENIQEALYLVRENAEAIRRRTFRVRWSAFKTTRYGFNLLGYPKRWLAKPLIQTVYKSLTPFWVVELYRKLQPKGVDRSFHDRT